MSEEEMEEEMMQCPQIKEAKNQCVFTVWTALCLMMKRVMLLSLFHVLRSD